MSGVPRGTEQRLARLEQLVLAEAERQNLISAATIPRFRERHLADSLQLLPYLAEGPLLDIGSGAGFPGLVLACCMPHPVHLVEPRAMRAQFLALAVGQLGLAERVVVHACRVERLRIAPPATITARAVASLDALFGMAAHLAGPTTRWVLPKGRTAAMELEAARATWQGMFRMIPSITDTEAAIVLAEQVRRRLTR